MELTKATLGTAGIVGGASIFALAAAGWNYVKSGFRYVSSIIISDTEINKQAAEAVISFSMKNKMKSPFGIKKYAGINSYVHPHRTNEVVGFQTLDGTNIGFIKYKGRYALLSNTDLNSVKLKAIRGTFDIEGFIIAAIDYRNKVVKNVKEMNPDNKIQRKDRFKIVRIGHVDMKTDYNQKSQGEPPDLAASPSRSNGEIIELVSAGVFKLLNWKLEDLVAQPEEGQTPFTGYPFPKEVHDSIKYIDCWMKNEPWFRCRSIPYKTGILLAGNPGSGKSTLAKAIGLSFNLPVYAFDLNGMTNEELTNKWDSPVLNNTPCIVLIEDIDNIFHGREYVGASSANSTHLTFDCLLNCISGIKQSDGVLLIITTNHIEKVDPALGIPNENGVSSRPGRIDKVIHLGLMQKEQRLQLANHILSDFPELIDNIVNEGEGETAAQFQHRCAKIALAKFWDNQDKFSNKEIPKYVEAVHIIPPPPANDIEITSTDVGNSPYPLLKVKI